jgi:hypothetical protein
MTGGYIVWQVIEGPVWLITFAWNMQQALARYFSVAFMFRTLAAHWHKDVVPYEGGGMSRLALAFAWNLISRGVGLFIRSLVLLAWLMAATLLTMFSLVFLILFTIWPLLVMAGLIWGISLILLS